MRKKESTKGNKKDDQKEVKKWHKKVQVKEGNKKKDKKRLHKSAKRG